MQPGNKNVKTLEKEKNWCGTGEERNDRKKGGKLVPMKGHQ